MRNWPQHHHLRATVLSLLSTMGSDACTEYRLPNGQRLDVAAHTATRDLIGVEIKTSIRDLRRDLKWSDYLHWCRWFYFAVPITFPVIQLPLDVGVIVSDATCAKVRRPSPDMMRPGFH
jgi:hypothetical protein